MAAHASNGRRVRSYSLSDSADTTSCRSASAGIGRTTDQTFGPSAGTAAPSSICSSRSAPQRQAPARVGYEYFTANSRSPRPARHTRHAQACSAGAGEQPVYRFAGCNDNAAFTPPQHNSDPQRRPRQHPKLRHKKKIKMM